MEKRFEITSKLAKKLTSIGVIDIKYLFDKLENAKANGLNEIIDFNSVTKWQDILEYYGFDIITTPAGLVNKNTISWDNDEPFIRYNKELKFINAFNQILKACSEGSNCITDMDIDTEIANKLNKIGYSVHLLPIGKYFILW
jgi:hypothetical protein